jgi:hypothetical protein
LLDFFFFLFEVRINLYIEETQQKERRKKIIIKPLKTQAMAYKMTCEKLLKKVKKNIYIYKLHSRGSSSFMQHATLAIYFPRAELQQEEASIEYEADE